MKLPLQVVALLLGSAFAITAAANDTASSKAPVTAVDVNKLVATCGACHGKTGHSTIGMYPNLAGQYNDYLEHALKAYRSGERKNAIMNAQAKNLTDDQIEALANYFAQQPPAVYVPALR